MGPPDLQDQPRPQTPQEDLDYVKAAFHSQYNWIAMAGAGAFALVSGTFLPIILGAGLELIYLAIIPQSSRFRRLIRSLQFAEEQRKHQARLDEMLKNLPAEMESRYVHAAQVCASIRANFAQLSSASQIFLQQIDTSLQGLLTGYARLLLAAAQQQQYLQSTEQDGIKHEIAGLQKALSTDPPKVQEINQKRIEILTKRLEKFNTISENRKVVDAQCSAVEDVLMLVRDQSVTMRDPQQVTERLDSLVHDVEQTEQTVQQVEAIFNGMSPDMDGLMSLDDGSGSSGSSRRTDVKLMSSNTPANTPASGKYLDALPAWARELSEKYYSRSFALFVLCGNVRDLVPLRNADATKFVALDEFLSGALFGQRDIVLHYDRGGLNFGSADSQADFRRALEGYDSFHGTSYSQGGLPRNPDAVLNLLDNYLRLRIADGKKIGLVIDFAETIAPAGDMSSMSADDRNALVILKRWARNTAFLNADVTICLISENQIELNQGIVQNPGVSSIGIPLPDYTERLEFIRTQFKNQELPAGSEVNDETLAKLGAGLKRVQIQSLISRVAQNRQPLTLKFLSDRKRDLIESESGGLNSFRAGSICHLWRATTRRKTSCRMPPRQFMPATPTSCPWATSSVDRWGRGKTFITTCFAGEVGIPAVTLKNFRSMWQGVTEGNLERVLTLLKAMSPIAVIVDEADAQLGDRSSSGDSGVGNRVFAQIAQFMGNTEYRGKVIWFLLTCRPDLLPVDLKRQGRAEEHIALFYPDTQEERLALLRAMLRKTGMKAFPEDTEKFFLDRAGTLSGADIEAVLVRSRMRSSLQNKAAVDTEDLKAALEDFIPPYYPTEIDLQNLVAVMECTSKSLLPKQYRDMDRGDLIRRTNELLALSRQTAN